MSQPLISVVTPFHNTAKYLSECIESVLAQSYGCFEYILVDNCSTDGASEIAEAYARRDGRIRFVRRSALLPQVRNYNSALTEISDESQYCKIVQADDYIFPNCLQLMVQTFEHSKSIGLVSSYDLKRSMVRGSGFPYPSPFVPGKEMARLYLQTGSHVFGSPSTVMYRSSIVRNSQAFFDEGLLHEDTEKCMQILQHWDFGFVHQVLSFLRADNESISSEVRTFQPDALDRYIIVKRYASAFLEALDAVALQKESKRAYYRIMATEAVHLRGSAFWQYHEQGLQTIGEKLDRGYLGLQVARKLLGLVANPGFTIARGLHFWKRKMSREAGVP